jgi:hypothetical protein
MMSFARSLPSLTVLALVLGAAAAPASAQTKFKVDGKTSLAFWQMSPNFDHLWATTCPGDPDWRPGDSRTAGWTINPKLKLPSTSFADVEDTVHVPLFPRHVVAPVCVEAVRGEIDVADTVHWQGVHGLVAVQSAALISGSEMNDVLMHRLMGSTQHPEVIFTLDSLIDVKTNGDTVSGRAIGTIKIMTYVAPVNAVVEAFHDSAGMRVLTKWLVSISELDKMTPSLKYYAMGIQANLWKHFMMGADLVLVPSDGSAPASAGGGR